MGDYGAAASQFGGAGGFVSNRSVTSIWCKFLCRVSDAARTKAPWLHHQMVVVCVTQSGRQRAHVCSEELQHR